MISSELALLEITRALLRGGADPTWVPYYVGQALRGVYVVGLSSTVLDRARSYQVAKLGSLGAIHLATADPFRGELTGFLTYDSELASAANGLGFPVATPT